MKVEKQLGVLFDEVPQHISVRKLGNKLFEIKLVENFEEFSFEGVSEENSKKPFFKGDLSLSFVHVKDSNELKGALIRMKYSVDKEYAMINKGIEDKFNIEYMEYNDFRKECKEYVNQFWIGV